MNMNLGKLREMVRDREAWRAAVHGIAESDTTDQLNNTFIRGEMLAAMLSLAAACGLDRKWGGGELVKRLLQSFI